MCSHSSFKSSYGDIDYHCDTEVHAFQLVSIVFLNNQFFIGVPIVGTLMKKTKMKVTVIFNKIVCRIPIILQYLHHYMNQ